MSVLIYRGGKLSDKADFFLGEIYDEEAEREEFLMQYYSRGVKIPKDIYIDEEISGADVIERYLREKSGHAVYIHVAKRGEMLSLTKMAKSNALEHLSLNVGRTGKEVLAIEELGKLIGLSKTPVYIECYDISNLASSDMVGGMVVLENARPNKKAYKKFNIKTVYEQNDYACMQEVLRRRFENYLDPECDDEGFKTMPDLIFLDGGKGHVMAVTPVVRQMGIDVPIFGLVKDNKHHTRAIVAPDGSEIVISKSRAVFSLLTRLQDEVHRYTISFQAKKHLAKMYETELMAIKGIGKAKTQALLTQFKTKEALKSASVEDIAAVMKISFDKAAEVKERFIDEIK